MITFSVAKAIVRAAEEANWNQGTYQIEDEGWEDATHYLVVRGTAEDDPNLVIIPGQVPLVSKATGEIEYVVAHAEWDRLDAMTPVSGQSHGHPPARFLFALLAVPDTGSERVSGQAADRGMSLRR